MLKRIFQTDVLTWPRCGAKRRVVAVVLAQVDMNGKDELVSEA
jgi:hypothetical protein